MFKIFIAEDEIKTLNSIKKIIEDFSVNVDITGTANTVESAVNFLSSNKVDLLLLDINFPDGTAFDILKNIEYDKLKIIFITAFEEYALKAIKVSASDYLLKPLNPKELLHAVNKIKIGIKHRDEKLKYDILLANFNNFDKFRKLVLKTSERMKIVNTNDIVRCESDGSYTVFFLSNSKKVIVSKPLKEYEEILSNSGFLRVHKSHLLNISYIDTFEKKGGGYMILKDLSKIPVSVRKKDFVLNAINNFNS